MGTSNLIGMPIKMHVGGDLGLHTRRCSCFLEIMFTLISYTEYQEPSQVGLTVT